MWRENGRELARMRRGNPPSEIRYFIVFIHKYPSHSVSDHSTEEADMKFPLASLGEDDPRPYVAEGIMYV